jgi:hypothetical protein
MTAALAHLTGPAMRRRGGRLVSALALVLPIPLFAALGLSLPLPATVERLAAKLVPYGHVDSDEALVRGSITLAPGERRDSATVSPPILVSTSVRDRSGRPGVKARGSQRPVPATVAGPRPKGPIASEGETAARPEPAGAASPTSPTDPPAISQSTSTTTPPASGSPPVPTPPTPAPAEVVQTATTAVNQTIAATTSAATGTTDAATNAAQNAAGVVTAVPAGVVPGPPKKP